MRQERTVQASIFDLFAGHEIGRELKAMSAWLDDAPRAVQPGRGGPAPARGEGRPGGRACRRRRCCAAPCSSSIVSSAIRSWRSIWRNSASFRAFARLPHAWSPQKSVLHQTISAIRAETWEQINRALLASARESKLERGRMVRLDSTVTAALIHEPSDSSLLWDAVRVMVRLLREADGLVGRARLWWRDHRRAAKKRARDDPVHPRSTQAGSAVSRADQNHARHLGLSRTRRRRSWPPTRQPTGPSRSGRPRSTTIGP